MSGKPTQTTGDIAEAAGAEGPEAAPAGIPQQRERGAAAGPLPRPGGGGGIPGFGFVAVGIAPVPDVHGAEPGVYFTISGGVSYSGGAQASGVNVTIGNVTYTSSLDVNNRWRVTAQAFHAGDLAVRADAVTADRTAPAFASVHVTLDNATPQFTVVHPSPDPAHRDTVRLNAVGTTDYVCQFSMSDQFGPRTITASWEAGQAPVTVVAAAASFDANPQGVIQLDPTPIGNIPITFTCSCMENAGDPTVPASQQTAVLAGIDFTSPTLTAPDTATGVADQTTGQATVHVTGSAYDSQSGMAGGPAGVFWAPDPNAAGTLARTSNDWASWSIDATLGPPGVKQVYIWAIDAAGNATTKHVVTVTITSNYVAPNLNERLNDREYLTALIDLVAHTVVTASGAAVGTDQLYTALGQPFDRLSEPDPNTVAVGAAPVNELRVPLELIRGYLSAQHADTAPGAAAEAAYRAAAYDALLTGVGTSSVELRLAAGATDAERTALAGRIGVTVDHLPDLTLLGDKLTETALENLFGLLATDGADPLRTIIPQLLVWQQAHQLLTWGTEDAVTSPLRIVPVLIDPDVVGDDDIVSAADGATARGKRGDRSTALSAFTTQLQAARAGQSQAAGFTAMLALTGWIDLATLAGDESTGRNISGALTDAGLTRAGYLRLQQLQRLATAGTALDSDWADAAAILTRAHKRHELYPTWRTDEAGVVLSPTVFTPADQAPPTNFYRAEPELRAAWTALLGARAIQQQTLGDSLTAAVARAEQLTLPALRDALLADVKAAPAPAGDPDPGGKLTGWFELDVEVQGSQASTRVEQAITALISLLLDLRAGELPERHPAAGWTITDQVTFDRRWATLGTQATWQNAALVFLFAEQHLDPTLLIPAPSTAFSTLTGSPVSDGGEFTGDDATTAARTYLTTQPDLEGRKDKPTAYLDPTRPKGVVQHALVNVSTEMANAGKYVAAREVFWAVPMVLARRLQAAGHYREALDWFSVLLPAGMPGVPSAFHSLNAEWQLASLTADLTFPPDWADNLNPFHIIQPHSGDNPPDYTYARPLPYLRFTLLAAARCHLDYADAEFALDTDPSRGHARELYLTAQRLLSLPQLGPLTPPTDPPTQSTLDLPEQTALSTRAQAQLAKLRQGRTIAGQSRTQISVPDGGTTRGTISGTIGQPTPYHFKTLLDRARQLTATAQQIEAGYLAALEKFNSKTLELSDAQDATATAAAQLTLAQDKVTEATDAVTAAAAQQAKADTLTQRYQDLVQGGPNQYENALLRDYGELRNLRDGLAGADLAIGVAKAVEAGASGLLFSAGASAAAANVEAVGVVAKGVLTLAANDVEAQMQANQLQAGIEQRRTEWQTALIASQQDSQIAKAQVAVATDQSNIATQEQTIASLGQQHAQARLTALQNALTGPDLYSWLADTLGAVYRYFLRQATATARLAQDQLSFERAEPARNLIAADYTQMPADLVKKANGASPGLAGAERLAADVDRLDEYAFSTATRRLNISQTLSLAQLMPSEFLQLRRTGTMTFTTPQALFDADFPGQYLRLISGVSVSVVALVPPGRGIRATLASNGVSRVTRQADGVFEDIVLRHDPGTVALTSPMNATGVFALDAQPELLRPFEGQGVVTSWEFSLPPAANPFDFTTIADVLLTVDYTALFDGGYYSQVTADLNAHRARGSDCLFSLARDLPDQWYALSNPTPGSPRTATLTLRPLDFPISVTDLTTTRVTVNLTSTVPVPSTTVTLQRAVTTATGSGPVTTTIGGAATTTDGTAGTGRGAAAWTPLLTGSPVGDWQVSFGPDAEQLFTTGALTDITVMIGWSGLGPAWT